MDFIEPAPQDEAIDAILSPGVYETGSFGNNFNGATDDDGIVSFVFQGTGTGLTLYAEGYDIDTASEVSVILNNTILGTLAVGETGVVTKFHIEADLVVDGTNVLRFVQTVNPEWRWGVTDVLLVGPGPNQLPFSYDPEFSEDGHVAWQVDNDGFYLGRIDLDTGGFLGIVNYLPIQPITWFETVQAVELIRTPDGIAAIGMTEQGLIYLDEDEGYLLEGTEGLRFSAMPKGEVPGLRFVAYGNGTQYLYDNGTLIEFDRAFGQAFQWLNDHEVLTRNERTGVTSILDIETWTETVVTETVYNGAQAAAFTTSDGEQLVTLQGDGYRDFYSNTGDGWELKQRMVVPPFHAGGQHFSAEFFEWEGRTFISGFISDELGWTADSAIVLYDLENDWFVQISGIDTWKDPEVLILNDGTLAYYADRTSDSSQQFSTISYERAMLRAVLTEAHFAKRPGAFTFDGAPQHVALLPEAPALPGAVTAPEVAEAADLGAIGIEVQAMAARFGSGEPDAGPAPRPDSASGDGDDTFVFKFRGGETGRGAAEGPRAESRAFAGPARAL